MSSTLGVVGTTLGMISSTLVVISSTSRTNGFQATLASWCNVMMHSTASTGTRSDPGPDKGIRQIRLLQVETRIIHFPVTLHTVP